MGRNYLHLEEQFPGKRVRPVRWYLGKERLPLPNPFVREYATIRHEQIDAHDIDGDALLASDDLSDNMAGILTGASPERVYAKVLRGLAKLDHPGWIARLGAGDNGKGSAYDHV